MGKVGLSGKYQTYPEYKDSGVEWLGAIPTDWDMWKITHACPYVASGTTPKSDGGNYYDGANLWVTTGELREGVILDTTKKVTDKALYDLPTLRIHPKGSVVIAMYGATIGRLGILGNNATTNQACCVMPPSDIINNKYLFYWLYSTRQEIINLSSGGGQPNVNQEKISSLKVSAPTYKYQVEIANFLDHETAKIDTLIEKQQQLIKLLKEKRQAVISQAVTKGLNPNAPMRDSGVEWLGEVPEHWDLPKLIHMTSRIGDGLHSTPKYQDNTGYYFVNGNNLVDGQFLIGITAKEVPEDEYESHYIHLDESSVLLSINGTIGNVARYNNEKIILGKSAAYINCSGDLLAEYLMLYLQTSQVSHYFSLEITGTTIFNLSLNSIRQMKICIPSKLEQLEIYEYCQFQRNKYDMLIYKTNQTINLMKERRTALISAAVTGKIDVRDWVAPEPSNNKIDASLYGNGVDLNKEASL
jgi:type I restriction enzyme S subunit